MKPANTAYSLKQQITKDIIKRFPFWNITVQQEKHNYKSDSKFNLRNHVFYTWSGGV